MVEVWPTRLPEREERPMNHNEKLIEEARRAKRAVYLATDASVADDLSRIIGSLADALEAAEKARFPTTRTDEMIAPEDAMTLEELGEAIANWSPAWDGDEAMHSLVYRFIEHYAALDGEVYAAREEHDFEPDAEILFRYDDESGTLVRVPSAPQGEPSDARVLAALNEMHGPYYAAPLDLDSYTGNQIDQVRRILRAASAVTERGENR